MANWLNSGGSATPRARVRRVSRRVATTTGCSASRAVSNSSQRLLGGQRGQPDPAHPGLVAIAEVLGHRRGLFPHPPGDRQSGQSVGPSVAPPARRGSCWPPHSYPDPGRPRYPPSTKTSRTPTNPDLGSAHANATLRRLWPATPYRCAPASTTRSPHHRAPPRHGTRRAAGYCAGTCASSPATASRSPTSQATTDTWAPASRARRPARRHPLAAAADQHHVRHPVAGRPGGGPPPNPPCRYRR